MPFHVRITVLAALAGAFAAPAAAQTCPDAASVREGYAVERGEAQRTEVFHDGPIVRTMMRFKGQALLETTQFQGLFELDRLDRGRRATFRPTTDLGKLFPVKSGQRITAEFEFQDAGGTSHVRKVQLVVGGAEDLYVGPCKYRVLKIERSETRSAEPPRFLNWDYYSPELKLILAKEFRERDGRTSFNKFDKVMTLQR
jgi:hypothetical protein